MTDIKIGLALGSGSARGLAHIPLLEVFDELGIKPALIVGCSMGALVGVAYASGLSAAEIADHVHHVLGDRMKAAKFLIAAKGHRLTDLLSIKNIRSLQIDGTSLVEVVLPRGVAERLQDTHIPFQAVTTDFDNYCERVLDSGPTHDAIAASIAIPGIIRAPKLDGRTHMDGGVFNPVPFDHAGAGMDMVVAVDVTGIFVPRPREHPGNLELLSGSRMMMSQEISRLRRKLGPEPDIYLEPDVNTINPGDFFRVKEAFAAGTALKDTLKRSLEARMEAISKKGRIAPPLPVSSSSELALPGQPEPARHAQSVGRAVP